MESISYAVLQALIVLCKVYGIALTYTLASGYNDTNYRYTYHVKKADIMTVKGMIAGIDAGRRVGNNPQPLTMPARDRDNPNLLINGKLEEIRPLFWLLQNNFGADCYMANSALPDDPTYNTPDEIYNLYVNKKRANKALCSFSDSRFKELQSFAFGFLAVR